MTSEAATISEPALGDTAGAARRVSRIALAFGALTLLATAAGVATAAGDEYLAATIAAWVGIASSVAAILFGVLAVVRGAGVGTGVAGIALGVLGDPLVLLYGLDALGRLG